VRAIARRCREERRRHSSLGREQGSTPRHSRPVLQGDRKDDRGDDHGGKSDRERQNRDNGKQKGDKAHRPLPGFRIYPHGRSQPHAHSSVDPHEPRFSELTGRRGDVLSSLTDNSPSVPVRGGGLPSALRNLRRTAPLGLKPKRPWRHRLSEGLIYMNSTSKRPQTPSTSHAAATIRHTAGEHAAD